MQKRPSGFTLVEIMVVVLVLGILMIIAIPGLLRSKMSSNDAFAKQAMRTLSTATEWYSNISGAYPASETALLTAAPPYLNSGYCGLTVSGYVYTCTFTTSSYVFVAQPVNVGTTGTTTITVSTGGVFTP